MSLSSFIPSLLATVVCAAGASVPAHAAMLSFQQGVNGYAGTADTTLMSSDPDVAHGADESASIDAADGGSPNHVLLRFDGLFGNGSGQIKADDTIVSAKITFTIDSQGSGVKFHDMLQAWNEASITWNSAINGIQTDGVEASAAPFFSLGADTPDANVSGDTFMADVTASLRLVQAGSLPGHGWALMPFEPNGTNGLDFLSKEAFLVELRPLLTVEVVAVPEPGSYALLLAGLGFAGAWARRQQRRNGTL